MCTRSFDFQQLPVSAAGALMTVDSAMSELQGSKSLQKSQNAQWIKSALEGRREQRLKHAEQLARAVECFRSNGKGAQAAVKVFTKRTRHKNQYAFSNPAMERNGILTPEEMDRLVNWIYQYPYTYCSRAL